MHIFASIICQTISRSLYCLGLYLFVLSVLSMKIFPQKTSKIALIISAVFAANAMVLYLSMTDHSPDYLNGMSVSEQVAANDPQL